MAICTGFIQPLNLECIFINTFAETIPIFIGAFLLAISYLAGKFKMNGFAFLSMLVLFSLIFYPIYSGIFILLLVIVSLIVYYVFTKIPT